MSSKAYNSSQAQNWYYRDQNLEMKNEFLLLTIKSGNQDTLIGICNGSTHNIFLKDHGIKLQYLKLFSAAQVHQLFSTGLFHKPTMTKIKL